MGKMVKVELEVTEEAAEVLKDEGRRRSMGVLVSTMVLESPDDRWVRMSNILDRISAGARARGFTDEDVDRELEAYNAERHS